MDQILPPELTDSEFESMRRLAVHPDTTYIPHRIQARLKDIGYATDVLGSIVLTEDGWRRLAIGRVRTSPSQPV